MKEVKKLKPSDIIGTIEGPEILDDTTLQVVRFLVRANRAGNIRKSEPILVLGTPLWVRDVSGIEIVTMPGCQPVAAVQIIAWTTNPCADGEVDVYKESDILCEPEDAVTDKR